MLPVERAAGVGGPVVFCSHASADKPAVLAFAERLRADGFDAWVDRWEIAGGDDFVAQINDGLRQATAGLIFFSHRTDASLWVRAEVNYLIRQAVQGLRLIPVMIDGDAPVPPLLETYHRRGVGEYEAIRDDLIGAARRPLLGALPERLWDEVLVQLTRVDGQVRSRVWISGAEIADTTGRLPALLHASYQPPRTDAALTEVGRACGTLLFPDGAAAQILAVTSRHRPGDRLDVVIEAEAELLRLAFETARLPVPGTPLLVGLDGVTVTRRPLGIPARLTPSLPGPLKILAAVAAPDEDTTSSTPLDGERELARILGAVPAHGAQVRVLEVASRAEITTALKRDAFHVLHLSGHGGQDGIELEDEDGQRAPGCS